MKHVVFCDFDGTITAKDTIDAMYDAFGPENWPVIATELYNKGLRSRQIIKHILGMLDCTRRDIVKLLQTLPIRDGFVEFHEFCRDNDYELIIMSEGIGLSVETVLHERGIDDLKYFGNVLVRDGLAFVAELAQVCKAVGRGTEVLAASIRARKPLL